MSDICGDLKFATCVGAGLRGASEVAALPEQSALCSSLSVKMQFHIHFQMLYVSVIYQFQAMQFRAQREHENM